MLCRIRMHFEPSMGLKSMSNSLNILQVTLVDTEIFCHLSCGIGLSFGKKGLLAGSSKNDIQERWLEAVWGVISKAGFCRNWYRSHFCWFALRFAAAVVCLSLSARNKKVQRIATPRKGTKLHSAPHSFSLHHSFSSEGVPVALHSQSTCSSQGQPKQALVAWLSCWELSQHEQAPLQQITGVLHMVWAGESTALPNHDEVW